MSLANNLKKTRLNAKDTQQETAKKLGLNPNTYSNYERGDREPGSDFLVAFATLYHTSVDALLDLVIDPSTIPNLMPPPIMRAVPRIGSIACGEPILAQENIEGEDMVPENIECDFTLRCKGNSMINAHIHDGDIVCIKEQPEVENGQIAAVLIDGLETEATLKRFRKTGDTIILMPENPDYEPMVFTGEEMNRVHIVGLAVYYIARVR